MANDDFLLNNLSLSLQKFYSKEYTIYTHPLSISSRHWGFIRFHNTLISSNILTLVRVCGFKTYPSASRDGHTCISRHDTDVAIKITLHKRLND